MKIPAIIAVAIYLAAWLVLIIAAGPAGSDEPDSPSWWDDDDVPPAKGPKAK